MTGAWAIDPFYERLEEDGVEAYGRGDYQAAAEDLKLACFGMLDEPPVLVECLVFLALAQADSGETEALKRTFDRITEVEREFGAFSRLDLDERYRQVLEEHLRQSIPYDSLLRVPALTGIARQQLEEQIRALPPGERREAVARRLEAEPQYAAWQLLRSELEFDAGNFAVALTAAEAVLASEPGLSAAVCLRGRAAARLGRCEQALVDLDQCSDSVAASALNLARTRCHIEVGDWDAADLALAELSGSDVRGSTLRQLSRTIRRGRRASAAPAAVAETGTEMLAADGEDVLEGPSTEPAATAEEDPAETVTEAPGVDEVEPVDPVREPISRFTELLRTGSREDLEATLSEVWQLAEDHTERIDVQLLAAEVAYRLSRWDAAITYFDRGGVFEDGRPEHQFYLAVSLYESGDRATAQEMLQRCLPQLEQTAFVRAYSERISSGGG